MSLFLANCQNDEDINNQKTEAIISYDDYLVNLQTTDILIQEYVSTSLSSKKQIKEGQDYFRQSVIEIGLQSIQANNVSLNNMILNTPDDFKDSFKNFRLEDLSIATIEEINLPKRAISYFKKLYFLSKDADFDGMVLLLNEFKKEKDNPDLLSLIGVFSAIELNNNNFLTQAKDTNCGGANAIAAGVVVGTVAGALKGALLGSFLGTAGTVLGALGGAIYGAALTSVTAFSTAALICAAAQRADIISENSTLQIELDENDKLVINTTNSLNSFIGETSIAFGKSFLI